MTGTRRQGVLMVWRRRQRWPKAQNAQAARRMSMASFKVALLTMRIMRFVPAGRSRRRLQRTLFLAVGRF